MNPDQFMTAMQGGRIGPFMSVAGVSFTAGETFILIGLVIVLAAILATRGKS